MDWVFRELVIPSSHCLKCNKTQHLIRKWTLKSPAGREGGVSGGEGTCCIFEAPATADVDRSGAPSFDPQFPLHFTLRTPTQNLFFSGHKNWVQDCGCKIASTNREKSGKNLQPDSTVACEGARAWWSNLLTVKQSFSEIWSLEEVWWISFVICRFSCAQCGRF